MELEMVATNLRREEILSEKYRRWGAQPHDLSYVRETDERTRSQNLTRTNKKEKKRNEPS